MKLRKQKLAVALGAALGLGMAGQASADVYGLGYLALNNLIVTFNASGTATDFIFDTDQNARLNGFADPTDGSAQCSGTFGVSNDCTNIPGTPVLSGLVQNAPGGSGVVRAENDYTKYGSTGDYSNAESAIVSATLVNGGPTSTSAIAESNLDTALTAAANTLVQSNTTLVLTFTVTGEDASFNISFDAIIDVLSQVTGGDIGQAQANSSLTVVLNKEGAGTMVSWAPSGKETITTCGAGLLCDATEALVSLNNSTSSVGTPSQVAGSGSYGLSVTGLSSGTYSLALASTTSTQLQRRQPVPVPGTLLLLGSGLLLLSARSRRR